MTTTLKIGVLQGRNFGSLHFCLSVSNLPQSLSKSLSQPYLYMDNNCIFDQHQGFRETKAALTLLNNLYDATCMIQLV